MRSLYVRIVLVTVVIVVVSALFGFWLANLNYQLQMKGYNEQKLYEIATETVALFEKYPSIDLDSYLTSIAKLNYQMYLVDDKLHGVKYGDPFREYILDTNVIRQVHGGTVYHGSESQGSLFVTGFFENTLANSIGVPLRVQGHTYALFLRPNIERMFGEVRVLFARLLLYTFMFSILLILVCTRYLVKPVQRLTEATKRIAEGDFNIQMDVSRSDEIGRLARDFASMASSLSKLDAMRQEFVANVSHEIQSPLTSIQGFSQALRTEEVTAEERESYLAIIESESRRLSSLSKQLLTLTSLDHAVEAWEVQTFRLDEQLQEVVRVAEWQWSDKDLSVDLSLPPVTVTGHSHFLTLVWTNLLTNSIKFTPAGGTIAVNLRTDEHDVIVEVRDTGIGIPEEELPHVFERFYKADKARNRNQAGSGLGLSIVHKIVHMHHGRVDVTSQLGQGTLFTVRLPRL